MKKYMFHRKGKFDLEDFMTASRNLQDKTEYCKINTAIDIDPAALLRRLGINPHVTIADF